MDVKVYNKLVRDKIPEIIELDGKKCTARVLDDEEYLEIIETAVIPKKETVEISEVNASSEDKIDYSFREVRSTDKKRKLGWLGKLLSSLFKRGKKDKKD